MDRAAGHRPTSRGPFLSPTLPVKDWYRYEEEATLPAESSFPPSNALSHLACGM